ncbi:MAG TPA: 4-alpha-glucanotransferase [Gemmatimonadaceae bacterium]|nr:4-alpha-glucanotransferase [Gemmatimonadaceae bacterium]
MLTSSQSVSADRPALRRLAARMGIAESYLDQSGGEQRVTTDATRERLLAAMGIDASTEAHALRALRRLRRKARSQWIAPVRVVRQRSRAMHHVRIRVPTLHVHEIHWTLTLRTEDGIAREWRGTVFGGPARTIALELPVVPPLGYHDLTIELEAEGERRTGTQRLIVVPSRCTPPEARLQGRRAFGITANLYTVRSARNWGAGDLADLSTLAEWTAQVGGDFVGVNPLHALRNAGYDVSPYSPITRLFRNPLYIAVENVPELKDDAWARERIASPEVQGELAELRAAKMLDYGRVMALRGPILDSLYRTFVTHERDAATPRRRAYAQFVEREDPQLTQFATFMAISEREGPDARQWPEPLRDANGAAVTALRTELADRVDFHRWLQFEMDRQMGCVASDATRAGLALGVYQDLAVGSAPSGSDVWANPGLFAPGATVGAPPDMYSDEGQNWGLPAINPHVLRETGYDYWVRLLRAGFRHSGALRLDHALGLFRMFWVPVGAAAREGTFVRSFVNDLFGILALESVRHGALVVGEDLGTVPPEVPKVLQRWGVLGSKVLVFERDIHRGRFRPAPEYPRLALATVNTHDLPPLVGWLEQRDIILRSEVGDLTDPEQQRGMRDGRTSDRWALIEMLIEAGLLPESARENVRSEPLIAALHAFLRQTPSALVGLALDDLAREAEPVNIPGIWQDKYPSWSRRMRETLETLLVDPATTRMLGDVTAVPSPS